jgi:hypothetical protein
MDDHGRRTAYAAVTAHLHGDERIVVQCVLELIGKPADAAGALLALILASGAMAELWGDAIKEEPVVAWARYARVMALETSGRPGGRDGAEG